MLRVGHYIWGTGLIALAFTVYKMVVCCTGNESMVEQLEKEWGSVALQTAWRLEPVYTFDDSTLPTKDDSLPATSSMSILPTGPSPRNAAENENESNNLNLDQSIYKGCEQ